MNILKGLQVIKAKPIVKWAGGKHQLIKDLLNNMPKEYNQYFEPFIGGGALFFELQPEHAFISDINEELINLYSVIKNNVEALIKDLKKYKNNKKYFLYIRNLDKTEKFKTLSNVKRASRFIYLNKTCFNGLYRVNSKGQFNVSFGSYLSPNICNEENLLNCSKVLKNTEIKHCDFSKVLDYVRENDFVYFDPPYVPLTVTSAFTSYTKDGFDMSMQVKLKEVCDQLNKRGVKFLLSNSDTQVINDLYKEYKIKKVYAARSINSKGNGRGKITEVLVRNY